MYNPSSIIESPGRLRTVIFVGNGFLSWLERVVQRTSNYYLPGTAAHPQLQWRSHFLGWICTYPLRNLIVLLVTHTYGVKRIFDVPHIQSVSRRHRTYRGEYKETACVQHVSNIEVSTFFPVASSHLWAKRWKTNSSYPTVCASRQNNIDRTSRFDILKGNELFAVSFESGIV